MNNENANTIVNKSAIDYFKYVPVIYPILVFLGYINYDFYYRKFDIDIFNYLTINEFLFSFVSIIYPIIFVLTGFISMNVYSDLVSTNYVKNNTKNDAKDEIKYESLTKPPRSFYYKEFIKSREHYYNGKFLLSIGNFILYLLFWLLYALALIFPYVLIYFGFIFIIGPLLSMSNLHSLKSYPLGFIDTPSTLVIVITCWYLIFSLFVFLKHEENQFKIEKTRTLLFLVLFLLVISTLLQYQNINSYNTIHKEPNKHVCFTYENNNIESTNSIILLGITADYLFLRNIEDNTNYIYELNEVKNLQITSLKKEEQINKEEK